MFCNLIWTLYGISPHCWLIGMVPRRPTPGCAKLMGVIQTMAVHKDKATAVEGQGMGRAP